MVFREAVIAVNPATGQETDLSAITNLQTSTYHPTAHGKSKQSTQYLSFRADALIGEVHEGWPWMKGWRDTVTRNWDGSRAVFCGQIGRQTGRAGNIRHYIDQTLDGWETTFTDVPILHWPNNDFASIYPVGYSIKTWLVGLSPYRGVLLAPRYDEGKVDLGSGIDPIFDNLILDATNLPAIGKSVVPGVAQFCYVQDFLDTMIAVANFMNNGMDPVAFFEPIVSPSDPTQIIPRFRFIDRNAVGSTPVAVFNTNPASGEWDIRQPFHHDRDLRPGKQRIIVVGKGGDPTIIGNPLVYVDYTNPAHTAAYPTWIHATAGRALIIVDERINTLVVATAIAHAIEAKIYGPEGRLTFRTTRPTKPGELIQVTILEEGQDHANFVVADSQAVAGTVGQPLYEVTIGAPAPDLRAIVDNAIRGIANDIPLAARKALAAGLGAQSTPSHRQAVDANPHSAAQNTVKPRHKAVVAQTWRANSSALPGVDPNTVGAANLLETYSPNGATPGFTVSPSDGRPHPQVYVMAFTSDGTSDRYINHWDTDFAVLRTKGTGHVTLNKNGVGVAGPFFGDGAHTFGGIHYVPSDDWSITVTGVVGNFSVTVSE